MCTYFVVVALRLSEAGKGCSFKLQNLTVLLFVFGHSGTVNSNVGNGTTSVVAKGALNRRKVRGAVG